MLFPFRAAKHKLADTSMTSIKRFDGNPKLSMSLLEPIVDPRKNRIVIFIRISSCVECSVEPST